MEETVSVTRLSQIHCRVTEMGVSVWGGGADVCEEGPLRKRQEKHQLPLQLLLQIGIACLPWSHLL